MAPVKRKRPHDDPDPDPDLQPPTTTVAAEPTRRATRQTPIPPPPIPTSAAPSHLQPLPPAVAAEEKPFSGRRTSTSKPHTPIQPPKISETPIPIPITPSTFTSHHPESQPSLPSVQLAGQSSASAPPGTRTGRQRGTNTSDHYAMAAAKEAKENVRPVTLVAPKITYQAAQPPSHRTGSLVRPSPPTSQPPITHHFRPVSTRPYHTVPTTVTAVPVPVPPTSTPSKPAPTSRPDKSAPRTDRNIDKVMLGNICFRAWYPSYYGKEVLGDASASAKGGGSKSTHASDLAGGAGAGAGAKNQQRKGGDAPMLDRLYVCPVCFKYSKELVAWWGHVRVCERAGTVPGRKVYVHPRGRRLVRKEIARPAGKKSNVAPKYTEEYVTDEGEWSVWEVDGEQDVLFCQNLSLFAKLFLDNKSVFFDVRGFNYFLLVYTPPPKPNAPTPRPHIVGFFSKEKMSWDNNNLACILVFPPWQRKGLGALLMGVSYEISRREGIIGGPEKPISELGRRGYKRFWGGEIARWFLGCPANGGDGTAGEDADPALLVDVEDCSRATWIALEDCVATLKDMGVVTEACKGPGKPPPKKKRKSEDGDGEDVDKGEDDNVEMEGVADEPRPDVSRVKIDKAAVSAWVVANRISLEKVCDPDGFVEGYAVKERDVAEVDE
ncbi:Males-absent on the first protein [Colletotrichum chlorophyti]|uniref:histone acetyltransferase n=1 Tax=Colletotrichum chlorophyti TaxID=708187 RepID=A0A1Q8S3U5_9PEZI|nr:Males-absent on the first protein [Colletotrichum chlorophyti]